MVNVKDFIGEETVGGKTFVTVNVREDADETAFKTIAFSKPPFVPPVTMSEENDEQIFSYDVTAERFVRLSVLPNRMTPIEYLTIMKNLTDALIKGEDYFMNLRNFVVLEDYVYVNQKNWDVRVVYAPFSDPIFSDADIDSGVFKISRKLARTDKDWQGVTARLFVMSESTTVYDSAKIFNALYDEYSNGEPYESSVTAQPPETDGGWIRPRNEEPVPPRYNNNENVPPREVVEAPTDFGKVAEKPQKEKRGFFGSKKDKTEVKKEKPNKNEKGGGMFSGGASQTGEPRHDKVEKSPPKPEKSGKGLFGGGQKSKPPVAATTNWQQPSGNYEDGATQPPPGAYTHDDEGTTQPPPNFANMTSARFDFAGSRNDRNLPETIRVEFQNGEFFIGRITKGRNSCDFSFSEGTGGVSERHARVTEKGGRYYITDIGSKYGTFVDYQKIVQGKEIELSDGEKVSFSEGVDYEFRIERRR